jgi:pilus assembly protein Flp/PilA
MSQSEQPRTRLAAFAVDDRGATAIEYGLIVALISVAMLAILFTIGEDITNVLYGSIGAALQGK